MTFASSEEYTQHLARNMGSLLRQARESRHLTTAELAERVAIPADHLEMIEAGEDPELNLRLAQDIATLCGYQLDIRVEDRE